MSRRRLLPGGPVAVVLAPLLLGAWATAAATAATATAATPTAPPATPTGEGPGIVVSAIDPAELRPGGSVTVQGVVQGGQEGLDGAVLELRLAGDRSSATSSLLRWTAPVDAGPGATAGSGSGDPADRARTEAEVDLGDVPAGGRERFELELAADDLDLAEDFGAAGAYGLQLLLTSDQGVVDDERGFLLWSPEVDVAATQLVTTLALTGPPALVTTGLPDPATLAEQVAPGGRLDRLLEAATALDADWLVQPTLLAGLLQLAQGGDGSAPDGLPAPTVEASPPGTAAPGPGAGPTTGGPDDGRAGAGPAGSPGAGPSPDGAPSGAPAASGDPTGPAEPTGRADDAPTGGTPTGSTPAEGTGAAGGGTVGTAGPDAARQWLERLRLGRDDREVVLDPWAAPAPGRLRAADDDEDAWEVLAVAQDAALPEDQLEVLLDGRVRDDVLDATRPGTTAQDVATLARGRSGLLLREDAVPLEEPDALTYTPDQVVEVRAGDRLLTAVLSDATLTADAEAALEGSPLAVTRVLARLATTSLQRPSDQRVLAVALPDGVDVAPGAAGRLATALRVSPWVVPVTLSTALGTSPAEAPREPLPTATGRDPVLGVQALLDAVADSRRVAAALADPVDPVVEAVVDLRAAASLSRHVPPGAPAELAEALVTATRQTVEGVRVVPGSRINLVAAEAALPVTVVNDLDTHASLVLQVRSRSPRLQVTETRIPVEVDPGQRTVVDVPVEAVASGRAEVVSQLATPDGRDWGPPSEVLVTVATQAEGRVLTGVGVAVGVLFALGVVRAFVRNRRGHELDETAPDGTGGPDLPDGPDGQRQVAP